jgi:Mg2+/Co2+ transporter CorB
MKLFGNVLLRILATFVASALGVIGAGSLGGVAPATAAFVGGILAVAKVIEKLSYAFLEDGKLSNAEINAAFQQSLQLKNVKEEEPKA